METRRDKVGKWDVKQQSGRYTIIQKWDITDIKNARCSKSEI